MSLDFIISRFLHHFFSDVRLLSRPWHCFIIGVCTYFFVFFRQDRVLGAEIYKARQPLSRRKPQNNLGAAPLPYY